MRIVVGLGNPGERYARTRHNVGFLVVEKLAADWGIEMRTLSARVSAGRGRVFGQPTLLVKPLSYMNLSGPALEDIAFDWYAEDLLVVHDDLDIPVGRVRLRHGGGSGGHRGVASIAQRWGAEFDRVRVGIGRPPAGGDAADFVLEVPEAADWETLRADAQLAASAVECVLAEGIIIAMNRFHAKRRDPGVELDSGRDRSYQSKMSRRHAGFPETSTTREEE